MVESPSEKATRKDSVSASPEVEVEYPLRMVAGTTRADRTAERVRGVAVDHAEAVVAVAKRARGEKNFMVDVVVGFDK